MNVLNLLGTRCLDGQYLDLIRSAYEHTRPNSLQAAVAYATQSGVADLEATLRELPGWDVVLKRWLVGIDYCRSDPLALAHLRGFSSSEVRIFDGSFVSESRHCVPRKSYHPKAYMLRGAEQCSVIIGSGNLSRTGLYLGVEAAASVHGSTADVFRNIGLWFSSLWEDATPFTDIEDRYARQYESIEHRRLPTVSEDDIVPESALKSRQIRPDDLRKLRVCRHLWIQAGNLHRNLGHSRPGNQLMLRRNSRVFFGFPAVDLEQDSLVGSVAIRFREHTRPNCSLRFSNNSMDVLTLPVPGSDGPTKYDQETLHFENVGVRTFDLTIGRGRKAEIWRKESQRIGGAFCMKSGRQWGVY